jgi:hypothetical protein
MRNRGALLCRVLVALTSMAIPPFVEAQSPAARVQVQLAAAPGSGRDGETPVQIELRSDSDPAQSWSVALDATEPVVFRFLPPGRYRLIADAVDFRFDAVSGEQVTLEFARATHDGGRSTAAEVRTTVSRPGGYGTRFDSTALRLLPQSGSIWGLVERADPLVVTDRIEGGGAYPEMQRIGGSGASWTQTSYRLGEADITDPDSTGFPLLYPNLDALEAMRVITAGHTPDVYGGGTSVTLVPRRPSPSWQRSAQFLGSPHGFQSVNVLPGAPSIARLQSNANGSFVVSGPVSSRLGLLVAGALGQSSRLERDSVATLPSRTQDLSAHLVFAATAHDEFRVFAQNDHMVLPSAGRARLVDAALQQRDRFTVLSSTWDHRPQAGLAWTGNLTYASGASAPALSGVPITGVTERLRDGVPWDLAASAASGRERTYISWRGDPGRVRIFGSAHLPQFGANASFTGATREPPGDTIIGELVDGRPARAFAYAASGPVTWSGAEIAFWATDRIPVTSRLDLDAALRVASTTASRAGSAVHIPWRSVSPSIQGTWRALPNGRLTLVAGYAKYSSRLPLDYLAWGDPNSLFGSVHTWIDRNGDRVPQVGEVGSLLTPVGPCCAGGQPNTIDPDLRPPYTNEFLVGVHTRLGSHFMLRLGSTDRRQYNLIEPVDAANVPANFTLTHVPDPGLDMARAEDDQMLPVFERLPASFGTDRYTLQNVANNSARDHGVDLVLERMFDGRWGMLIGATAHQSEGAGGNRGFRADENDQGVLGEVFSDPNAATNSRGRLFFERGYVVKWSGIWRLPHGLQGSAAARYQDGQHFTRVVIAPDLAQGADAIPTLPRGRTRFTYTFTLDARVEKELTTGPGRATLLLEAYNLLNTNNEVEEDVRTGPSFRSPTAVQPPRSLRLGLRFTF